MYPSPRSRPTRRSWGWKWCGADALDRGGEVVVKALALDPVVRTPSP